MPARRVIEEGLRAGGVDEAPVRDRFRTARRCHSPSAAPGRGRPGSARRGSPARCGRRGRLPSPPESALRRCCPPPPASPRSASSPPLPGVEVGFPGLGFVALAVFFFPAQHRGVDEVDVGEVVALPGDALKAAFALRSGRCVVFGLEVIEAAVVEQHPASRRWRRRGICPGPEPGISRWLRRRLRARRACPLHQTRRPASRRRRSRGRCRARRRLPAAVVGVARGDVDQPQRARGPLPFIEVDFARAAVFGRRREGGRRGQRVVGGEEDPREVGRGAGVGELEVAGAARRAVGRRCVSSGVSAERVAARLGVEVCVSGRGLGAQRRAALFEDRLARGRRRRPCSPGRLCSAAAPGSGSCSASPIGGAAGEVLVFDRRPLPGRERQFPHRPPRPRPAALCIGKCS